ncbi:MAG: HDIG domain-containing protein [Muribaculaceae bacterium]|nr:HDIG domain-containing protein [Muribaculaceae bacterium]
MTPETKHSSIILLMLTAAVIIISLALPRKTGHQTFSYEVNKPWLYPMLTAPFDIPKELDEDSKARVKDSVEANFLYIYRIDDTIATQQRQALAMALSTNRNIPATTRYLLINAVAQLYADGLVDNDTYDGIKEGRIKYVRLLDENSVAQVVDASKMRSVRSAYQWLDSTITTSDGRGIMATIGGEKYLSPNIINDQEENEKLLNDALLSALAPRGTIMTGEAIIFTGNVVTPEKYTYLKTYEQMLSEREQLRSDHGFSLIGKIIIVTILFIVFFVFMKLMRPRIFVQLKSMLFLILFITLFIVAVFLVTSFRINYLYLVPFAIVPIIITTFFDARTSFFIHMVVVLICSLVAREQAEFIIMQFLAGGIAIVSMQELTKRSQLVRCAFFIFLAYSVAFSALYLVRGGNPHSLGWHFFMYFAINCVVLSFAYFGIFIVEKVFGFTSTVTLVELSDINNRVLRDLSEKCPGTFQHVLQVANIAQEAAYKIGANMQLVRAGALYHDIGKIENPAFFTENQSGVNPHDALDPEQSARIIIEHVNNGLKIAEKAGLPQAIKDLIAQHHGKSVTKYFFSKAKEKNPNVDPEPFSYPGPNPQTKEAAILMMADSCEAAAKSLKEYNEEIIVKLVQQIIDSQVGAGLFRESPISFKDVETVKRVFIERLCAFYHTRISYPEPIATEHPTDEED